MRSMRLYKVKLSKSVKKPKYAKEPEEFIKDLQKVIDDAGYVTESIEGYTEIRDERGFCLDIERHKIELYIKGFTDYDTSDFTFEFSGHKIIKKEPNELIKGIQKVIDEAGYALEDIHTSRLGSNPYEIFLYIEGLQKPENDKQEGNKMTGVKQVKSITLLFENTEEADVCTSDINMICLNEIHHSICKSLKSEVAKFAHVNDLFIVLKPSARYNIQINKLNLFNRLNNYRDLTAIIVKYTDDTEETIALQWKDVNKCGDTNKYQKSRMLEDGSLAVYVGKSSSLEKEIKEYKKAVINNERN